MKNRRQYSAVSLFLAFVLALSGCGENAGEKKTVSNSLHGSAGVSGVLSVDTIAARAGVIGKRSAALLGIFVSEYVSIAPTALAAEGALMGIGAQMQIAAMQNTVQDPDFELLQAFADALQVDVPDMLNRSTDRQEALDVYSEALTNVASRSNDRFKELSASLTELKGQLREIGKQRSDAERALKNALKDKDFADAGEKQKAVNETQTAYASVDLQRKQTEDMLTTLEKLLTLYGDKIQAIEANREVLISGTKVVVVPGIDELRLLEKRSGSRPSSGKDGSAFDGFFQN